MSNTTDKKELKKEQESGITGRTKAMMIAFVFSLAFVAMVAPSAMAGTLNDTLSPILGDVAELFTPIVALIIAIVPAILTVSVIGFVLGIFDAILTKIKL